MRDICHATSQGSVSGSYGTAGGLASSCWISSQTSCQHGSQWIQSSFGSAGRMPQRMHGSVMSVSGEDGGCCLVGSLVERGRKRCGGGTPICAKIRLVWDI